MASILIGILIAMLICALIFAVLFGLCALGPKPCAICCGIAAGLSIGFSLYGNQQSSLQWAHGYEAQKSTIEISLQSNILTGFERAQLVQQASEANKELAKRQYYASQWYGFDEADYVLTLEPVSLE